MEFTPILYIVYLKVNSNNYIVDVRSSAFLADTTGWIEYDRGYGDKYHHAQGNYFQKPIRTFGGAYRYKMVNGMVVECTTEEISQQETSNTARPTTDDVLNALLGVM